MQTLISNSEEETRKIGNLLAAQNRKGCLICLQGDLGTGKTQLTKGIAEYFGIDNYSIKSPTYTYIREYELKHGNKFIHVDLYRIEKIDELLINEIKEHLENKKNIIVIEWSDKMATQLPKIGIQIKFEYLNEGQRKITINESTSN